MTSYHWIKMKLWILILTFVNSSCGQFQQFPVEYHYNYSGRIATGIPSIRNQVSATGILAQLIVQMKSELQGLVKIQEIKVGTFNDHVDANKYLLEELPIIYHPMDSKMAAELEQPFGVNFIEDEGHVMTVPKNDTEFITNLRKSISGILRIQPILKKIDDYGQFPIIKVFGFEEESIFGRCESQYTMTQIPPYTLTQDKMRGEEDSSGIAMTALGDKKWRLVKTIDFDKCHDQVILMHSGTANISKAGYGQSDSVKARSSVSTYFLRGSNDNLRIDKAYVEGSIALNPFGDKLQKLQAITNQTLTLLDLKHTNLTKMRLPLPTRNIKTWNYEVASPFSPPSKDSKSWVNYYNRTNKFEPIPALGNILGFTEKIENITVIQEKISSLLDIIVEKIDQIPSVVNMSVPFPANLTGNAVLSETEMASKLMRYLTVEEINAIFDAVQQSEPKKLLFLIDILAASGSAPPMKVILDKIKSGNISNARIASIFMTLTNHLVSPVIVPELMEYAMTMEVEQNPFLSSAVLINFASMVHRICVGEDYRNYTIPYPVFGNETCQIEPIINKFLPYLVAKVESSTENWQKSIYLEALSNLGTPVAMESLKNFITKDDVFPMKIRLLAISALSWNKMPDSVREEVFSILMDVANNLTNVAEIRQASIEVLLSWHPEASWWQRMAKQTWQEPFPSIVSFMVSAAQSISLSTDPRLTEQANIASFVLPLMKPASPSIKDSINYLYSKYNPASKMTFNGKFSTFTDSKSKSPSEIHLKLENSFGGFNLNLLEFSFLSNGLEEQFKGLFKNFDPLNLEKIEMFSFAPLHTEILQRIKDVEMEENMPESLIRIKFLDHITSLLPLSTGAMLKLGEFEKQPLEDMLESFLNGRFQILKYLNPLDIQYFIPTELGLPIIGSVSLPIMITADGSTSLQLDGLPASTASMENLLQHNLYQLSINSYLRLVSKLVSSVKIFVPWEECSIEAGVDNYKELVLPFTGNITFTKGEQNKLDYSFAPSTPNEFPLYYAHNFPFTQLRTFNSSSSENKEDFKLILANEEHKPLIRRNETFPIAQAFGQNISLEYQADESYPFTKYHCLDLLRKPEMILELLSSPTSKYWQMSINHYSNESFFKPAKISLSYMSGNPTLIQKNFNEDNYLSKLSSINKAVFFGNGSNLDVPDKKVKDINSGSFIFASSVDLFPDGSNELSKHSIVFVLTKPDFPHVKGGEITKIPMIIYQTQIGWMAFDGETNPPIMYDLISDFHIPKVKNIVFLAEVIKLGLMTSVKGRVTLGASKYEIPPQIIAFEGKMTISPERKDMILYELNNLCNNVDSISDLQTDVIYDNVNIEIDYEWEKFPKGLQNLTFSTEKFLEGLVWPHGEYNALDIPNQPFKMSITGNRSLASQYYSFWINKPEENVFISELPISDSLTTVVPIKGFQEPVNELKFGQPLSNNMCALLLYEKVITTFDGLRYPYIPESCWTLTSHDIDHKFVIYTNTDHRTGMHQAQIKMPNENIVVQVDKYGVKVNGSEVPLSWYDKDIYGSSGTVVMKVKKVVNGSQAYIPGKMLVVSMLGIYFTPDPSLKNNIRGICGNFDGNLTNDLLGPKQCIYHDVELFKFSWTIPTGDHCEESDLDIESNLVRRFQRNCTKAYETTGNINATAWNRNEATRNRNETTTPYKADTTENNCSMLAYPVERVDYNGICITLDPYPNCQPYCDIDYTGDDIMEGPGKCWPERKAPPEIKKGAEVGYLLNQVKEKGRYPSRLIILRHNKCKPKVPKV